MINIMYFYNMFKNRHAILVTLWGLILLSSCQQNPKSTQDDSSPYEIVIQHSAGDDYTGGTVEAPISYMSYPFNMGYIRGKQADRLHCILLSKKMSPRSRLSIKPIAVFNTIEQGAENSYIIAIPTQEDLRSLALEDFSDLVTKHNAVKSIIEFWLINRCGLGCAENVSWGNENSAAFVLEKLVES